MEDLSYLTQYATARQLDYLEAIQKHGSNNKAAKELNINRRIIDRAIRQLKFVAATQGLAPTYDMVHPVPDGFNVKGVSTYYGDDGKVKGQWVKTTAAADNALKIRDAFVDAMRDDLPRFDPINKNVITEASLLNVFVYGDPHIGMRAWAEESGENHDLALAETLFTAAHEDLVKRAPAASTAIILNLGDYYHADDGRNVTLRSGHNLDVDGRYQKVRKVGFKILRSMIDMTLERHDQVIVWNIPGNHDDFSAIDLSLWLEIAYEKEPRVQVDTNPSKFYFYKHGKTMLAATHGDTLKPDQMLGVMASDKAEMWGLTSFRYAHIGHVHHKTMKDLPGVAVETHRVLQPSDLYAHSHGYRSQRDATCITYHDTYGEYARTVVNPAIVS